MNTVRLKRLMIGVCGAAVGVLSSAAWSQDAVRARDAVARQAEWSSTAARASRELARVATVDLQVTGGNDPRDFRIAQILVGIAHKLAPEDETLLRLLIDAASSSGDRAALLELTRELVRVNRQDTVAQLRLLSGAVSSRQDSDSRLAAYEDLLGAKGAALKLDGSILSRLALDAALLLRERGDLRGFAEKLSLATELDSTNKDAASLAVTFYTDNASDPAGRLTLLISLLMADPFDPETHLAMARELASAEAFTQASRFYQTYEMLLARRGEGVPTTVSAESSTLAWAARGADHLVTGLRENVERERSAARDARRIAEAQDRPLDQIPEPEQVRLTPALERVRFAAALAAGDPGQIDYAYTELVRTYEMRIQTASDTRANPPQGVRMSDLLDAEMRLRGELMSMRLWAGRDLGPAEEMLNELKQDVSISGLPESGPVLRRLEAWLLLQKGELDAAEAMLKPLADSDVVARVGLCVLEERRGRKDEAVKAYESLARDAAGSLAGAYARTRYEKLTSATLAPPPMAAEMDKLAAGIPRWLEEMIADTRRFVSLQATLEPAEIGALDPARVRLRLRNVSPIPLALGPEKPINSRVLLMPDLRAMLRRALNKPTGAVVVRLDRRLRLLPQEELEVLVWADHGTIGWIMNRLITATVTVKWKVLQGFTPNSVGFYQEGPHCLATDTEYLRRSPSQKAADDGPTLVRWIETGTGEDVAEIVLLSMINTTLPRESPGAWPDEQREAIARAMAVRYPTLDAPTRVLIAATLPLPLDAPWLAPVEEAINADTDADVRTVVLALRVAKADDPRLKAAAASGDSRLGELAALVGDRLSKGVRCYATVPEQAAEEAALEQSGQSPR